MRGRVASCAASMVIAGLLLVGCAGAPARPQVTSAAPVPTQTQLEEATAVAAEFWRLYFQTMADLKLASPQLDKVATPYALGAVNRDLEVVRELKVKINGIPSISMSTESREIREVPQGTDYVTRVCIDTSGVTQTNAQGAVMPQEAPRQTKLMYFVEQSDALVVNGFRSVTEAEGLEGGEP